MKEKKFWTRLRALNKLQFYNAHHRSGHRNVCSGQCALCMCITSAHSTQRQKHENSLVKRIKAKKWTQNIVLCGTSDGDRWINERETEKKKRKKQHFHKSNFCSHPPPPRHPSARCFHKQHNNNCETTLTEEPRMAWLELSSFSLTRAPFIHKSV